MTKFKQPSQNKTKKPGLRMNELMAATRLPRSTLVHWIKEGLLPEPVRTSKTMAYYNPECVKIADIISRMQAQDMPLNRIKKLLKLQDTGLDIEPIVDLHRTVFGIKKNSMCNLTQFCDATGLTSKQVKELINRRILFPIKKNRFDTEDISIGRIYKWGFKEGIRLEDLEFQTREAERLVEISIDLSLKLTRDMPYEKAAEVKKQMVSTMSNIHMYLRSRIFKQKVSTKDHLRKSFTDERLQRKKSD